MRLPSLAGQTSADVSPRRTWLLRRELRRSRSACRPIPIRSVPVRSLRQATRKVRYHTARFSQVLYELRIQLDHSDSPNEIQACAWQSDSSTAELKGAPLRH